MIRRSPRDYLVVTMRFYPRFLKKAFIDEYQHSLSPELKLFKEFRRLYVGYGDHARAFTEVKYEKRFWLDEEGLANLERLSALSEKRNVHLICLCKPEEHCHVDLLLLMAARFYGATIAEPAHRSTKFRARLEKQRLV